MSMSKLSELDKLYKYEYVSIDADYGGEIYVILFNHEQKILYNSQRMRIAKIVLHNLRPRNKPRNSRSTISARRHKQILLRL